MQKNIGVYVTKRDLRSNHWNQECDFHTSGITSKDGSSRRGEKAKDSAVQYNSKVDSVECGCKISRPKHCHESSSRYIITATSAGYWSRSYVESAAGSVRKLPKKRIRKVYLPEQNDQAVGSTDMTSHIRRNRQPIYNYCSQKMSSKCVGGFNEITTGRIVSEKLSPFSIAESYNPSMSLPRSDMRRLPVTLNDTEIGSGSINNNQLASVSVQVENVRHELKTTLAGNSTIYKLVSATTQVEETKREYESKNYVRRTPTKYVFSEHTEKTKSQTDLDNAVEVRTEKILSSDTVVQVHNLEINSETKFVETTDPPDKTNEEAEMKKNNENKIKDSVIEKDQKKESVLEAIVSNDSKEANVKTESVLKNTSVLRRRFEALRRSLCRKEETKKVVTIPSHHTPVSRTSSRSQVNSLINVSIGIASDPPSLVARSYGELSIGPNTISKQSSKKSIPQEKQESSHDISSKYNSLDSETAQGVKGMFKLWGKKFNIEGNPEEERKYPPSYIESVTKVNNELFDEQPAPKEKEKKRFFFFKSKVKVTKKPKENEDVKPKPEFESMQKITTGRCEVTGGFSISSGGSRKKSIMVKKESVKRRGSPGELLRQEWLMKYSTNPKESTNSITLRWNNGAFPTSSSTLNLTEKSYDTDSLLKSASGLTVSDSPMTSSPFSQKLQHVNYLQMYQAWMIPKLILNRPIIPSKSENYGGNMHDVEILDRQWFIDKSKAFAHQLELILHTKDVTRFNRKVSSEYITIDIPKDFFSDCSTGNNSPVYPVRLSDEEVYNIVEYETPINSEIMKKIKHKISKGTRFTESTVKKIDELPQKIDKDKPVFKDMETQRSADCDINNVLGVSLITEKDFREVRTHNDILCMESDYSSYNVNPQISERKCGFAESYLQEYYQKWMSMDLISWCMSYPKFKCYSLKDSRKSFSNDEGTRSCPNIHEEYLTPIFMSRSNIISTHSPYYNVQKEKISHDNVKSVKFLPRNRSSRIRTRVVGRVIPKDSLEVLKKRKINASRKNLASMDKLEKKDGAEGANKKRVSLGVDEIIKEILTPVASHKLTSKRSLPSNNSFILVSDPETVSTRSPEASERSLKSSAVNAIQCEKTLYSSTPRLSPKQSHSKVSCSGLKMGVMGILPMESSRHTLSSVDCLRSSVSKISFHGPDQSKKYSVHIVKSQHNNPVSSLVKLSNSQSLSLVVLESFESDATKCVTNLNVSTQGTNKDSLYNIGSQCEKTLAPRRDEFNPITQEQKIIDQISSDSLITKEETLKLTKLDESENSLKTNDSEIHQEIPPNMNDSLALKFELEKMNPKKKDESKNQFKSMKIKSNEIMTKHMNDLLTSNIETAIATSHNKTLLPEEQDEITENDIDSCVLNIVSVKGIDKSDIRLISTEQILKVKNTPSEAKLLVAVDYPTCKSLSKNTTLSHKTSALSLSWKVSGGTSARKIYSIEQNVFHENQRINKISSEKIIMSTQNKDIIQINSHEKNTVKVKKLNSSTEKVTLDCIDTTETKKGSAEIKHEANVWRESAEKQEVLSVFTHEDTCKTFDDKKISKENPLQKKSELSIANIIEIDFKLRVTNGDNATEIHVDNDGNKQNKINAMRASQNVLVIDENDSKYPINNFVTTDANGNKDINIKIMIKNFKNKTNNGIDNTTQKASKDYTGFPNNTSAGFRAVSQSSELLYSIHKATIDLTGKSGELIAFNNNVSHHMSDIIMLSKINTSESYIDLSETKSHTETRKKKMSLFGKITGRTKERFGKGQRKLSRRSKSDTLASENEVGTETSIDVYSKESNHSKSRKSLDKKVMGHKKYKRIDDTTKISSELPLENASRSKYQEKKELLKKVFQTANCLGKRKTKSRVRKLKTILKSILTSDSSDQDLGRHDLIKEITDVSLSMEKSSFASVNSILNEINNRTSNKKRKKGSTADGASENDSVLESNNKPRNVCACSTIAEKLICGGMGLQGCCCGKPRIKHEETNCDLANEKQQSQQIFKAESESPVIVQTQISRNDDFKPNNTFEQACSNQQLNAHDPVVDKESSEEIIRESIQQSAISVSNFEEPEITTKDIENTVKDVEVPRVKSYNLEEPEATIKDFENTVEVVEVPVVKRSNFEELETTTKEIENTVEDVEVPIVKSTNFEEPEITTKEIENTVEDVEVPTVKSTHFEEPEITSKDIENTVEVVEVPIVKRSNFDEPEITTKEIENTVEDIEFRIVESTNFEEPEITFKDIENTVEDVEVQIVKSSSPTTNDNIENVTKSMDDKEIISIQEENLDLTNNEHNKEDIIVRTVETTVCKPSRESKKIVITIDKSKKKNEEPKIIRKNYDKACISNSNNIRPCAFKMLDRNTKLGISDDDKIIFLESGSNKVNANPSQCTENRRSAHKNREEMQERSYIGPDILQLYETKKAVLQIYAEKRRTVYGEKIVADLPAYMANRESEIYRNYGDLVKHAYCSVCKNVM